MALNGSGTLQQWEIAGGRGQVMLRDSARVCSAALSSDARRLVLGGIHALARIWDLNPEDAPAVP